ncbi:hypothetical protein HNQ80_001035 [Anaerosolibacter carboniphilus]|uniref:Uncharacterized protein n=1 Tax=Anaerosolibacter carboniphilus TaxID=1417629 RepID=A0A841KSD0_9FIRM|nr:hypothetical protein [Anaerosolibacter carboniphilus]MBB6214950.1 hypothetical protein [Anaerosolibacter carboniphilus]
MPSQNKTQYVGLNQWQGNEYPMREDYNEDNRKTEAKIKENADSISALREDFDSEVVERPGPATIILNTWDKRVQAIMAKIASGLNFELNGNMVVNLLGRDGDCEDISKWAVANATRALTSGSKVFGTYGIEVTSATASATAIRAASPFQISNSKYYFLSAYAKNVNYTSLDLYATKGSATSTGIKNVGFQLSTTDFKRAGLKLSPTDLGTETSIYPYIHGIPGAIGNKHIIDGVMLIEITADEYNNMTVDQLLEKYPYVNSAQPTLNPVIDIAGKNLIDINDIQNGGISTANGVEFSDSTYVRGRSFIPVKPNTQYIKSINSAYRFPAIFYYDKDRNYIGYSVVSDQVFTTPQNCRLIRYWVSRLDSATIDLTEFKLNANLQIEEGTTATTYEPFRGTKTIVPTMLGKIGSYVDKLKYENGVFKKIKKVEKLILDGSLTWSFSADYAGFKRVSIPNTFNLFDNNLLITKYNGAILLGFTSTWDKADMHGYGSYLNITVADTDTGWGESYTPTADEIKAFFMGWKMYDSAANPNGTVPYNGTGTKAWAYRRESDGALTGGTTTLPTTQAPINNYWQPYTLYYALAQPVEEIINIPSICELPTLSEGINTIAVSSGLVYEKVNPALNSGYYHINYAGLSSQLKNKPKNILKVIRVKDGVMTDDTQNWIFLYVSTAYGGVVRCYITQTTYDSLDRVGAEYWVLYEVLPEEYNCQLFEGTGTHAENLRTAHEMAQETVKNLQKQAVRQIGDIPAIVKNMKHKGARVKLSSNQSIPNDTLTILSFASEGYDTNDFWNIYSPTKLVIPQGVSKIRVSACVVWATSTAGYRLLRVLKNGVSFEGMPYSQFGPSTDVGDVRQNVVSSIVDVVAGDYFEVQVRQRSGGALNVLSDSATWFSLEVTE